MAARALSALLLPALVLVLSSAAVVPLATRREAVARRTWRVPCKASEAAGSRTHVGGCTPLGDSCGRAVFDQFVSSIEVEELREVALKGMSERALSALGGPTIFDINSGFLRDAEGLVNVYTGRGGSSKMTFSPAQYELYRRVVERIRQHVVDEFNLGSLYFTAPTFITRAVGNASWRPATDHDVYYMPHVDKENTYHYDYSALLYLSDFDDDDHGQEADGGSRDFTGGVFQFIDSDANRTVQPRRGRLIVFSAGAENLHQVQKVESGTRIVMSLWFTCDPRKHFANFLDGAAHDRFSVASAAHSTDGKSADTSSPVSDAGSPARKKKRRTSRSPATGDGGDAASPSSAPRRVADEL